MLFDPSKFPGGRAILPVIHHASPGSARDSIGVAAESGADGVCLITQGASLHDVLVLAGWVRKTFPGPFVVGVNPLGGNDVAFAHADVDLVWTDESIVSLQNPGSGRMELPAYLRGRTKPWAGGCAFKTHRTLPPEGEVMATKIAAQYMDVVTTSGPGTGRAASVEKIKRIHGALEGLVPLGLASGGTPENAPATLPFVSLYLVATGIERRWGVLDPIRTRALVEIVHG